MAWDPKAGDVFWAHNKVYMVVGVMHKNSVPEGSPVHNKWIDAQYAVIALSSDRTDFDVAQALSICGPAWRTKAQIAEAGVFSGVNLAHVLNKVQGILNEIR